MFRRLVTLATAATLSLTGLAAPAAAATAACRPVAGSPRCQVWTGTVDWVADGDTIRVDLAGDGTKELVSVRILGMQAMEQTRYSPKPERRRGDCHALAATARLERILRAGGNKVRLTSLKASSKSGDRPLRSVAVKINGAWQDVGQQMIRGGYALWLPFPGEWAWDDAYHVAAAQAAAEHRELYDTDSCGAGPAQGSGLTLTVSPDPDGADEKNLNGEWFQVHNPSASPVPIAGWWVRDSGLRRYTFPAGTVVPAGGDVHVHVGKGRDTATHKYWGLTQPILSNADPAQHSVGDGGYLFDGQGDLRAWMIYPCVQGCGSPLAGTVELRVRYRGEEKVEVVNTGGTAVDLRGHVLVNKPYSYRFSATTVLEPGRSLELYTANGSDDGLTRYWNQGGRILNDDGETVSLTTADQWTVTCAEWGSGRC